MIAASVALGALLLLIANCAIDPASERRDLALISEARESEVGRRGAEQVTAAFGVYEDARMQAFVSEIGLRLARQTKRAALDWQYVVIDDAAVNAFALPGGFVFVTRGLLSQLTSEAELAAILGHESGHIAARHGVKQMNREESAAIGVGLGGAFSPFLAKYGDLATTGVGLLLLRNGREDESQADQLGFWYAIAEGYDTREMIGLFRMLQRDAALGARGRLPAWGATHPEPFDRIRDIQRLVSASARDFEGLRVERDAFVRRLDGMTFGEDPRDGYLKGTNFHHPKLAFTVRFPAGWRMQRDAQAVTAVSPTDDAIVQLRPAAGTAAEAARGFFSQAGVRVADASPAASRDGPVAGGEFSATAADGDLRGIASFIEHGGRTWALIAYAPIDRFDSVAPAFRLSLDSFEPLTDPLLLGVQPLRIRVSEAPRTMSLSEFNALRPSGIPLAELAMINGMAESGRLRAGQPVKRVVASPPQREGRPR